MAVAASAVGAGQDDTFLDRIPVLRILNLEWGILNERVFFDRVGVVANLAIIANLAIVAVVGGLGGRKLFLLRSQL